MLQLYPSNKTEYLAILMSEIMKAKPLQNPFDNEVVLIQSHGMGTWLQQEISEHIGIAAMIECVMPASFIWKLAKTIMPEDPHIPEFEKVNLRWEIFHRLPEKLSDPLYHHLANYIQAISLQNSPTAASHDGINLNDDTEAANLSEQTLFELSDVLADLFDAYQNYRPDWISAWESGERCFTDKSAQQLEAWQSDLWRSLYPDKRQDARNHRTILFSKLLERLSHLSTDIQTKLPERIFVFGLSALPPQWLPIISALSQYCEVHFLVHNPCQYYWGDVMSETQQLKLEQSLVSKGVSAQTAAETFLEGNTLLASWGRLGRDYLSILVDRHDVKEMPVELYEPPATESALAFIQTDILYLQAPERRVLANDESIRFASCHSHLREVEALHDYLLKLLDQTPSLNPKDIIVMMPDVQDFAALIDAVFSRQASWRAHSDAGKHLQSQYLPYGISDQMLALDQPIVDVLSGMLKLSSSRVSATEVLDWLDIEAIRARFGIPEDDLEQIHRWVNALSIRWGLSETHRDHLLSMSGSGSGNTWFSAFRRLLAGYVHGVDGVISLQGGDVSAQTHSQQDVQVLAGKLMRFLDVIEQTGQQQHGAHHVDEWLARVSGFWLSWFDSQYLSEDLLRLMDQTLASIHEQVGYAGFDRPIDFNIIAEVVTALFEKERVSQRFLAGRINFCTLMPMRSIPFKVVCMLGMNEGQYPRPEQKMSFDLLSVSPSRVGDRSRREDDRYLFLEALCSARSHFYVSYCGHDIKDNSERFPSILVSELEDYCDKSFYFEDGQGGRVSGSVLAAWSIKHRLQAFHTDYYANASVASAQFEASLPPSYNAEWLRLFKAGEQNELQKLSQPEALNPRNSKVNSGDSELDQFDFFDTGQASGQFYELAQFCKMADHPLRYYYQAVLGLSYSGVDAELENSEPFSLGYIDAYTLRSEIAQSWFESGYQDQPDAPVYKQWLLSDRLPRAPIADLYFNDAAQTLAKMKALVEDVYRQDQTLSNRVIDLSFEEDRVRGEILLSDLGMIEMSMSKNIANRFFGFWVKHVFWNVYYGRINCQSDRSKLAGINKATSRFISIEKVWTLPELDLSRAEKYAVEVITLFAGMQSKPDAKIAPFLARSTFSALFEKEINIRNAFNGVSIGSGVIQGEKDDPYWQRYCLFSNSGCSADEGRPEFHSLDVNTLPDLTESMFYKQVHENIDDIVVEDLVAKDGK
jgi:exodeoxyribonuclease V gamma subunit